MKLHALVALMAMACVSSRAFCDEWKPAAGRLMTRWAKDVTPEKVHAEYPRPQMVRTDWLNLNGLWELAIAPREADRPGSFDEQILVPFPVESALSGVMKSVGPDKAIWYRRQFELPASWKGQQVILHFGAVDWDTSVWIDDIRKNTFHRGGYDPFEFDITKELRSSGKHEIVVRVLDPVDQSTQPRGKQVLNPESIWYTPTSGIWQTVWLEPRPIIAIERLKIENPDLKSVRIKVSLIGAASDARIVAQALDGESVTATAEGAANEPLTLAPTSAKTWSPDHPFLYGLRVSLMVDQRKVDEVNGYFGLRTISIGKDDLQRTRMLLNGQPLFQYGPLDQGFWPDGLYTAPTDEALRYDLEMTKKLGFNMCRKHVKVEPDRWYYWCDKLGLLVWQDMPSGDKYIGPRDPDIQRSSESSRQYEIELGSMIDALSNHPCIVMWVPFNEGWGQFDTNRIAEWVKQQDPLRLVNSVSGWADRQVGDVHDVHIYPGPGAVKPEPSRASVLGEFGGLGLPIKGHTWQDEKNWGYRSFANQADLNTAYLQLVHKLRPLIGDPGLSAAVYTQTTDVEIEVNGLMTYDRGILKLDLERVTAAHRKLYEPPPEIVTVVPTSQSKGFEWRYTLKAPDANWQNSDFDDAAWKTGVGGFGQRGTPGAVVRTEWTAPDIWLRRTIELPADVKPEELNLLLHHDEDAEIYINGQLVAKVVGYTVDYMLEPLDLKAAAAIHGGKNSIAVHCKQTGGGQYIDLGIVQLKERR